MNQHTPRKWLNFEHWWSRELSKSAKIWLSKFFVSKIIQIFIKFFYHWRIKFLILYPPLENLTTPITIVITKRTIINFLAGSYLLTFCIFCHMLLHIFCCKKRGSIWKQIIIDQNNLAIIRAHSKWCDDSLTPFGQIGL